MKTPALLSDPVYHDETKAREYLERVRWPEYVTCPLCGSPEKIRPLGGESMGPGWWFCGSCNDKFTARVGTVMERSHVPLHKWLLAFRLMTSSKKGVSAHQLHRTLGITYKSAWFLAHRIREAMRPNNPAPLGGKDKVVEADETFITKRLGKPKWTYSNTEGWVRTAKWNRSPLARWWSAAVARSPCLSNPRLAAHCAASCSAPIRPVR